MQDSKTLQFITYSNLKSEYGGFGQHWLVLVAGRMRSGKCVLRVEKAAMKSQATTQGGEKHYQQQL